MASTGPARPSFLASRQPINTYSSTSGATRLLVLFKAAGTTVQLEPVRKPPGSTVNILEKQAEKQWKAGSTQMAQLKHMLGSQTSTVPITVQPRAAKEIQTQTISQPTRTRQGSQPRVKWTKLHSQFQQVLHQQGLLPDGPLLIAFSGGQASYCLLRLMLDINARLRPEKRYPLGVVHCMSIDAHVSKSSMHALDEAAGVLGSERVHLVHAGSLSSASPASDRPPSDKSRLQGRQQQEKQQHIEAGVVPAAIQAAIVQAAYRHGYAAVISAETATHNSALLLQQLLAPDTTASAWSNSGNAECVSAGSVHAVQGKQQRAGLAWREPTAQKEHQPAPSASIATPPAPASACPVWVRPLLWLSEPEVRSFCGATSFGSSSSSGTRSSTVSKTSQHATDSTNQGRFGQGCSHVKAAGGSVQQAILPNSTASFSQQIGASPGGGQRYHTDRHELPPVAAFALAASSPQAVGQRAVHSESSSVFAMMFGEVLPALRARLNGNVDGSIARTAQLLQADLEWLDQHYEMQQGHQRQGHRQQGHERQAECSSSPPHAPPSEDHTVRSGPWRVDLVHVQKAQRHQLQQQIQGQQHGQHQHEHWDQQQNLYHCQQQLHARGEDVASTSKPLHPGVYRLACALRCSLRQAEVLAAQAPGLLQLPIDELCVRAAILQDMSAHVNACGAKDLSHRAADTTRVLDHSEWPMSANGSRSTAEVLSQAASASSSSSLACNEGQQGGGIMLMAASPAATNRIDPYGLPQLQGHLVNAALQQLLLPFIILRALASLSVAQQHERADSVDVHPAASSRAAGSVPAAIQGDALPRLPRLESNSSKDSLFRLCSLFAILHPVNVLSEALPVAQMMAKFHSHSSRHLLDKTDRRPDFLQLFGEYLATVGAPRSLHTLNPLAFCTNSPELQAAASIAVAKGAHQQHGPVVSLCAADEVSTHAAAEQHALLYTQAWSSAALPSSNLTLWGPSPAVQRPGSSPCWQLPQPRQSPATAIPVQLTSFSMHRASLRTAQPLRQQKAVEEEEAPAGIEADALMARVREALVQRQLLTHGARILVAVSGGQDSLCLLHVLLRLAQRFNWTLGVVHANHRWRPRAEDNARHVTELAGRPGWDIPAGRIHLITASNPPPATEAAARAWRYAAFNDIAAQHGYDAVVTAHTATDRAETLIMNLARGCGMDGLGSLPWERPLADAAATQSLAQEIPAPGLDSHVCIVRPLLGVSRADVTAYITHHGLAYDVFWDTTNDDLKLNRNWVRAVLLPKLRSHLPAGEELDVQMSQLVDTMQMKAQCLHAYAMQRLMAAVQTFASPQGDRIQGERCSAAISTPAQAAPTVAVSKQRQPTPTPAAAPAAPAAAGPPPPSATKTPRVSMYHAQAPAPSLHVCMLVLEHPAVQRRMLHAWLHAASGGREPGYDAVDSCMQLLQDAQPGTATGSLGAGLRVRVSRIKIDPRTSGLRQVESHRPLANGSGYTDQAITQEKRDSASLEAAIHVHVAASHVHVLQQQHEAAAPECGHGKTSDKHFNVRQHGCELMLEVIRP